MEELGIMWAYEESMEEMKQKLLCTTVELESVKMEAAEEMKKYKDNIKQLLGLLKVAYQERDEARDQVHKLLDKLAPPKPSFGDIGPAPSYSVGLQPDNCLVPAAKANSSVTESNNSHSPVDSFLDAVSSPDSSSLAFVNNQRPNGFVQECGSGPLAGTKMDPVSRRINELSKGKPLPQKGKLLKAVTEAGPLLQTLLVAGPLPQWRNPPPLQPIRIPPVVSINGYGPAGASHRPVPIPSPTGIIAPKPFGLGSYHDMPHANPQMCLASMWTFMDTSGSPYNTSHRKSSGPPDQIPMAKRQRFQC